MNSIQVLLSDTHFGVRNNSINWLESQKDFVYNQFIPYLKRLEKNNTVEVFHLGDVFDSRSSISPMICKETNLMLEEISLHCDMFTILAGNHDFFSPIEGSNNSTSLEMLPCMWKDNKNINILTEGSSYFDGKAVCIPWFDFHNPEKLKDILEQYDNIETILTHTDLDHLDPEIHLLVKGKNIITGHIHIPNIDTNKRFYTLGSCYALNYQDADSERGFYRIEDWDLSTLEFIPNTRSIQYHRITDEDILDYTDHDQQDYVELIVKDSIYERPDIQEAIKNMYSTCHHFTVVIDQQEVEIESISPETGMYAIVKNSCPENLRDKLDIIVEASNQ